MEGQRFGALLVVRRATFSEAKRGKRCRARWLCRCDCGQERLVIGEQLRVGAIKACNINGHRWIHEQPRGITTLYPGAYRSFGKMKERCYNPKHDHYIHYGGRGITICERWCNNFAAFFADMGEPPPKHSIERRDVNGNYEPDNCYWTTDKEQRRNQRRTVFVEYEGQRVKLVELCEQLGLSNNRIYNRLKAGWSLEEALTVPIKRYKK